MSRNEFEIKRLFTREEELPEIVQEKKRQAYEMIYAKAATVKPLRKTGKSDDVIRSKSWRMLKTAGFILACFLTTGGTVAAAVSLLTRWDRLRNMDKETVEQYYEDLQQGGYLAYQSTRDLSEQERIRYQELKRAYESDNLLPEFEIKRLSEGEAYSGKGVSLLVTETGEENIMYLPETELTDEELLQIIEYQAKQAYALYETKREQSLEKENWESRLVAMTDEQVDYYYLAYWTGKSEISGSLSRGGLHTAGGDEVLTESEKARYEALETAYKEENLFPEGEAALIEKPEDYSGKGVALCRYDCTFYLPEELTDEELLQIIDFQEKASYSMTRIDEEIKFGYRKERPTLQDSNMQDGNAQMNSIQARPFADTEGKGSLTAIEEAQIGDIVRFGSYEQDNNLNNGKEDIEWYVLDAEGEALTLLSVKILGGQPFAETKSPTSWENSSVRKWLNEDFYGEAFTETEQADILRAGVEPMEGTEKQDKVYLLSYQEFLEYFEVNPTDIAEIETAEDFDRQNIWNYEHLDSRIYTEATAAARADGVWYWTEEQTEQLKKFNKVDYSCANGKSSWWLRTTESDGSGAYSVEAQGQIGSLQYVTGSRGIRPVIQIYR